MKLAYLGIDESGSLPDRTPWFVLAGVLTDRPEAVGNLIRRAALRTGKRLGRPRSRPSEFKWRNSSVRMRTEVLSRLARTDVEVFTLTVGKQGRRIEDTPEHYACLVCELLAIVGKTHPDLAMRVDRHFVSAEHVAVFDTRVHRAWPPPGAISIRHVDSQHDELVQLADFVAGSTHAACHSGDTTVQLIQSRVVGEKVRDWPEIRRRWMGSRE